jgi:hypothetical protein
MLHVAGLRRNMLNSSYPLRSQVERQCCRLQSFYNQPANFANLAHLPHCRISNMQSCHYRQRYEEWQDRNE